MDIHKVRKILLPHQLLLFDFIMETGVRSSSALRAIPDHFKNDDTLFAFTKKKKGGLRSYKIKPPANWKSLIAGKRNDEPIFPQWSDYPRFVEKACKKIQKDSPNFRIFTLHSLRHRRASLMNKAGKTTFDVMCQMGHENI